MLVVVQVQARDGHQRLSAQWLLAGGAREVGVSRVHKEGLLEAILPLLVGKSQCRPPHLTGLTEELVPLTRPPRPASSFDIYSRWLLGSCPVWTGKPIMAHGGSGRLQPATCLRGMARSVGLTTLHGILMASPHPRLFS